MINLKVGLRHTNDKPVDINYYGFLKNLFKDYLDKKINNEPCHFLLSHNETQNKNSCEESEVSFSPLLCNNYEKDGEGIIFKDDVNWYINCQSYDKMLKLVQKLYNLEKIYIGDAEFEIFSVEAKEISDRVLTH